MTNKYKILGYISLFFMAASSFLVSKAAFDQRGIVVGIIITIMMVTVFLGIGGVLVQLIRELEE